MRDYYKANEHERVADFIKEMLKGLNTAMKNKERPEDDKFTWRELLNIWYIIYGQHYKHRGGRL